LRYADVLLMYAEAKNEAVGPDVTVFTALNVVRKRVEFAGEGSESEPDAE